MVGTSDDKHHAPTLRESFRLGSSLSLGLDPLSCEWSELFSIIHVYYTFEYFFELINTEGFPMMMLYNKQKIIKL